MNIRIVVQMHISSSENMKDTCVYCVLNMIAIKSAIYVNIIYIHLLCAPT